MGEHLQANRRPDPARVEGWREAIKAIGCEVTYLEWFRDEFARVDQIVRGNPRVLHAESYFTAHVKRWYAESQAMRIRRLVEPYTPGFDVWSLLQLLEDMRRAAEAFGKSEIESLFDTNDSVSYEREIRDFLVESMWKNVGDVDSGADRLRARHIKEDIKGLRDATEDVKRYADLVIAHNSREKPAPAAFSTISSATDEIVRIAKRYTATLTGASMISFAPVDQFNWYDVFHFPWIAPSES
jgi:hypothetical protein